MLSYLNIKISTNVHLKISIQTALWEAPSSAACLRGTALLCVSAQNQGGGRRACTSVCFHQGDVAI